MNSRPDKIKPSLTIVDLDFIIAKKENYILMANHGLYLQAKDKLCANIAMIETSIKAKAEKAAIASLIIDSLEELLVDCRLAFLAN